MLDCPVPTKYLDAVPKRDAKEFTHMRYTAATCDPSEFVSQGYTLRQALLGRQTELFIVMVRKEKVMAMMTTVFWFTYSTSNQCMHLYFISPPIISIADHVQRKLYILYFIPNYP